MESVEVNEEKQVKKPIYDKHACMKVAMCKCIERLVELVNELYKGRKPRAVSEEVIAIKLDSINYGDVIRTAKGLEIEDTGVNTENFEFLYKLAITIGDKIANETDKGYICTDAWCSFNNRRFDSPLRLGIITICKNDKEKINIPLILNENYSLSIAEGKDNIRTKIKKENKNMENKVNKYYIQDSVNLLYDMRQGYEVIAKDFLETLQAVITNKPEDKGNSILNTLILFHGRLESIYSTYGTYGTKIRCIDRADILSVEYINSLCKDEFDIVYDNEGFKLKLTNYHTLYVKEEKIITQLNEDLLLNKYKIVLEVDIEDLYEYEKDVIDLLKRVSQEGIEILKFELEDNLISSSFIHKLKLTKDRKSQVVNRELPIVMYYVIPKDLSKLETYPPIYLYEDIEEATAFKRHIECIAKNAKTLEDPQELVILTAYVVKKK